MQGKKTIEGAKEDGRHHTEEVKRAQEDDMTVACCKKAVDTALQACPGRERVADEEENEEGRVAAAAIRGL